MSDRVSCLSAFTIFLVLGGIVHAQNHLSLAGTVRDAVDAPIAGASIALISEERVREVKSEANGSFAFHQVTIGDYEIEVTAPGFRKQTITLKLQDQTPPLSIALRVGNQPDEELCGSHASLTYGPLVTSNSQLSGTVQDYVNGQALQDAEVTIWKAGDSQPALHSHSDASGRFRFGNLPRGRYDLRISKAGYWPVNVKQLIKPLDNGLTIHATILRQNTLIACQ